ncbi:probable inactive serine/threonine-protein kinase slob2 [Maniola hyperantus]|uniref:probable inactive serine/threonine-protein kinase slob2 n=1 Tax=Aphantopus hyperantus TaxID=2795564 RepID=UPI001569C20C|nr:probable inactive serine/threonine-protein kinase slob2 [Maniola hyperantus]
MFDPHTCSSPVDPLRSQSSNTIDRSATELATDAAKSDTNSVRSIPKCDVGADRSDRSDGRSDVSSKSSVTSGRLVASMRPSPRGVAVPVTTSPGSSQSVAGTPPPPPPRTARRSGGSPSPRAAPPPPARRPDSLTHKVTEEVSSSRKAKRRTSRASPPHPR